MCGLVVVEFLRCVSLGMVVERCGGAGVVRVSWQCGWLVVAVVSQGWPDCVQVAPLFSEGWSSWFPGYWVPGVLAW